MAGGIATTANHQGTGIATTATPVLATVLRAGAGHRKGIGPPPGIRLTMGGNWLGDLRKGGRPGLSGSLLKWQLAVVVNNAYPPTSRRSWDLPSVRRGASAWPTF